MKTLTYKGCTIEIYESYFGEDLYITRNGEKVYSARCHKGKAMERVEQVLG